jgi:glycosidase
MDMVVNHSGRGARIALQRPSWLHDDATCASLANPVIQCSLHGLPDFAQEQPVVADYLTALSKRWVARVQPDGIRLDTAKHMPPSYLATSFVPGVRAASDRSLFLIAEVFDTDAISHIQPELDAGFDSAFHFPLQHALVETFAKGGSVNAVGDAVADTMRTFGRDRALRLVTMLDNHDMPRFMTAAPQGLSVEEMDRRYAIALTALFTLPGIPQIYQGDELGMVGVYPDNRRDMPAWAWDASTRIGLHDGTFGHADTSWSLTKRVAMLRASEEALWRGDYEELSRQTVGGANVLVFVRRSRSGALLVVLGNDDEAREVSVPLGSHPAWHDESVLEGLLGGGAPPRVAVREQRIVLTVPPKTAAIYRASATPH